MICMSGNPESFGHHGAIDTAEAVRSQHGDARPAVDAERPALGRLDRGDVADTGAHRVNLFEEASGDGRQILEAGAPDYIDRQMNTPYASGARWFMQGPFNADAAPEMGWQSKLVPKEIYRLGIADTDAWSKAMNGKLFAEQDSATQDKLLQRLEAGDAPFDSVPPKIFFNLLLQNTKEGFFCDPVHGGNKGMVGWTMIGFPGARADFMDWVERNEQYPFPAVSIRGERA